LRAAADGWCGVGIAFVFLVSPKNNLVYYEGYKIISFLQGIQGIVGGHFPPGFTF
jgi:hypothetical protein